MSYCFHMGGIKSTSAILETLTFSVVIASQFSPSQRRVFICTRHISVKLNDSNLHWPIEWVVNCRGRILYHIGEETEADQMVLLEQGLVHKRPHITMLVTFSPYVLRVLSRYSFPLFFR